MDLWCSEMLITYNKTEYDCSDEFSFKDFTGRGDVHFGGMKADMIIYGSCFSHEIPDIQIFPDIPITFIKCNLDNVRLSSKQTAIDCWQRRFKVQNDRNDWLIDAVAKPVMPFNHKVFTKMDLPMPLPKDIPLVMVTEVVDLIEVAKVKKTFLKAEVM